MHLKGPWADMTKAWLAKCPATPPEESGDNRRVPLIDRALDRAIKTLLPFVSLGFRDALPRLITRFHYTLQIQGGFLKYIFNQAEIYFWVENLKERISFCIKEGKGLESVKKLEQRTTLVENMGRRSWGDAWPGATP